MNVDAAKYAQTFTRKKDTFTKLLSQHTFQWQPEEYVIDFGCGTGNATKEILLNLNPGICQIVGADRELGMLQYAQEQNGDEKITYKVADIEDFSTYDPSWKNKFTKLFSFYTMHWVRDQKRALQHFNSILKVDGEMFLVFTSSKYEELQKASEKITQQPKWRKYFEGPKPQYITLLSPEWQAQNLWWSSDDQSSEYKKIAEECGFQTLKAGVYRTTSIYKTASEMKNSISSWNPLIPLIPQNLRPQFMDELFKYLIELGIKDREWTTAVLSLHAKKILNKQFPKVIYLNPQWQSENLWWQSDDQCGEYAKIVEKFGFRVLNVSKDRGRFCYQRDDDFKAALASWSPLLPLIPEDQHSEFMDEFYGYLKEFGINDCTWNNELLILHAAKIADV